MRFRLRSFGPQEAAVELTRFSFYDKNRTDTSDYAALVITRETKDHPRNIFLGNLIFKPLQKRNRKG